jgi:hypothetical protein
MTSRDVKMWKELYFGVSPMLFRSDGQTSAIPYKSRRNSTTILAPTMKIAPRRSPARIEKNEALTYEYRPNNAITPTTQLKTN